MDEFGNRRGCCSILYRALGAVFLIVIAAGVLFLYDHICETQTNINQFDSDLCNIKDQMNQMKTNVESGTKRQLEAIGKDAQRKLDEVEKLIREIKGSKGESGESGCCGSSDSSGGNDALRKSIKAILAKYDADKTGKTDFALEASGGSIISSDDTEPFEPGTALYGIPICCAANGPRAVIQANVHPGECWAFKGSSGSVTIKLLGYVFISGFSVEHISKRISPSGEIDSAPKEFSVWGLTTPNDADGTLLGRYTYVDNELPLQYFKVAECPQASYQYVQLKVHSNHGNPRFTCVYRLRVHGTLDVSETST